MQQPCTAFAVLTVTAMGAAEPVADVGSEKQLFIDKRFIESSEDVTLTMNPPQKLGPVLLPDKPWETDDIGFCVSVMEYEGQYRMYYMARSVQESGLGTTLQKGSVICLATSTDGEHWQKPNLGVVDFLGSRDNNILFGNVDETTVFLDPHGPPEARFKALCVKGWPDPERAGFYIYSSPDGLQWATSDTRVFPLNPDTANQAAWDARIGKYVAYIRVWDPLRKIGRVEMDDITQPWPYDKTVKPYLIWGEGKIPVTSREVPVVFGYDERDPVVSDHYNAAWVQYPWAQDVYFMFPSAYLHLPEPPEGRYGDDGLLDIQMAVSRDGIGWTRPSRAPYVGLNTPGTVDSKSLYMAIGMLRRGDEILQYYGGYQVSHGDTGAQKPIGSLCCLAQRLDGFVSADAAWGGGTLTTPPITFEGTKLELNIDCSAMGSARVEIRDASNVPVPGFTLADSDVIHGNAVHRAVTWQGSGDVGSLARWPVRLHFQMRAAKLYAFQFLP